MRAEAAAGLSTFFSEQLWSPCQVGSSLSLFVYTIRSKRPSAVSFYCFVRTCFCSFSSSFFVSFVLLQVHSTTLRYRGTAIGRGKAVKVGTKIWRFFHLFVARHPSPRVYVVLPRAPLSPRALHFVPGEDSLVLFWLARKRGSDVDA